MPAPSIARFAMNFRVCNAIGAICFFSVYVVGATLFLIYGGVQYPPKLAPGEPACTVTSSNFTVHETEEQVICIVIWGVNASNGDVARICERIVSCNVIGELNEHLVGNTSKCKRLARGKNGGCAYVWPEHYEYQERVGVPLFWTGVSMCAALVLFAVAATFCHCCKNQKSTYVEM